jgi:hypothetical protein
MGAVKTMSPQEWSRIQQGIFAGESGGDYGALFGYQNRPNGRFSGVDLTKMTVDQALDFANPSGPYGQYVKGQVGRVATPMGAYQIVGTTLRAAKEGLGLQGDEVLTPAMQDKLGQWIYKTQGTGAWEGYKPMTDAQAIAAETMTTLGQKPQGILAPAQTSTKGPQMMQEQKPQGLLGSLGIQKRDEAAGGETAQPFYQRDTFKDTAAVLAQGFGRMGIMGMEEIADDIAKQRTENKARNKTAEYLRKAGRGDLADMVDQGMIGGREAAGVLLQKPDEKGQVVSAAQLREMYPGSEIAEGLYNLKKDNTITKVGGAPQVVIDQSAPGAESELRKKLMGKRGEELAAHISAGNVAAGRQSDLSILQELAPLAPSGPVEGRFAEMFPEFNDVAAVRQSVVRRIAPTMRVEGSGSTSDIEFNAMLDSFGSLRNTPEANMAISQAMINKAQFDMQRRNIVQQYSNDQIDLKEMDAQIAALESNFSIPSQVRSILDKYSTKSEASSGNAGVPEVGTVSDGYRFKGGNPADQNNWEKI